MYSVVVYSLVQLAFILCVHSVPLTNQKQDGAGSSPCAFPSLICNEPSAATNRCLKIGEICDGVQNCGSGQDEVNCERKDYVIDGRLISSRELIEDINIGDVSQESCAKFCSEVDSFKCVGFQHNLQSNQCRLLDAKFITRSDKPSLRSFWITFKRNPENSTVIPEIPITRPIGDVLVNTENEGREFDGFEGGFDAIIVEVDWDSPSVSERTKRRAAFSSDRMRSSGSCGRRNVNFEPPRPSSTRLGRVVNGVDAPVGAIPWQASIKLKDGGSLRQWCGGAIISERLVLTAAHCIDHLRKTEFVVVVGDHDTSVSSSKEQIFPVENFIIHSKFKSTKGGFDIALVKLATVNGKGIVFGDVAQPICLPSSDSDYKPGTWCSVSGWGMQKPASEESVSNVLKVASVPLISSETCNKKEVYGNQLNSNTFPDGMLCAGYLEGGTDACRGDSGGPLACSVNGQFQLLGLVSWGDGCADKNKPGVYTKTLHYLNWIQDSTRKL
ncbi:urokinase-type plasminogen activator-like [Daphnia pulicaria]|uniref:urokinase-type plasminogen activator-like n=1 Tax=Daphnia pulicaria TaxID=35523 RepID=UPI001EEB116F|nr:urokinase-type plasminogen activator-like [Daphnia pulicaria]